jgi:hypothetical protein
VFEREGRREGDMCVTVSVRRRERGEESERGER